MSSSSAPVAPPFAVSLDVGADGQYLFGQYEYDCLLDKRTWETPAIRPAGAFAPAPDAQKDGVRLTLLRGECLGAPAFSARVQNEGTRPVSLGGLAFTVELGTQADFCFPLNTPHGVARGESIKEGALVQGGLVSPAIHVMMGEKRFNLLFHDECEKWSLGVYRARGVLRAVFIAALECVLPPGQGVECGTLYIQTPKGDPMTAIREFFDGLGFKPARGGIRGGVLYSCHPNGTMDGTMDSEQQGPGLAAYAETLPALRAMGVDHVWLLPIFEHTGRGVYHTSDQSLIDPRYGGDEAVRVFVRKAHELGMTVLFDYVPHGPARQDALALEHEAWCSRRPDGSLQEEWDCVSFDMTNPDYQAYTTALVRDHVNRFGIDGARIDCAMGGLSNWRPGEGRRPSQSNLAGGVAITRAIFDGFRASGAPTLVLPENFNPVPAYYAYTDVFYGMNLYRLLVELDQMYRDDPAAYVRELTTWLDTEHRVLPQRLGRLRFLGNHDTVSWVWQASRAADFYGLERAKALFALLFLIDGMPMLYMGDEDPALAGKQGTVLRLFFTELIALRKRTVGDSEDITHLYTGNGVFACARQCGGARYLVAVSLSPVQECAHLLGHDIRLSAYEWSVTRL